MTAPVRGGGERKQEEQRRRAEGEVSGHLSDGLAGHVSLGKGLSLIQGPTDWGNKEQMRAVRVSFAYCLFSPGGQCLLSFFAILQTSELMYGAWDELSQVTEPG